MQNADVRPVLNAMDRNNVMDRDKCRERGRILKMHFSHFSCVNNGSNSVLLHDGLSKSFR